MGGLLKFLKETREELKHVVWPKRDEVVRSTIVVLWSVLIISLALYGVDRMLEQIFYFMVSLRS